MHPHSPLGKLLVAPQGQLAPQHARAQSVAMPHALPQQMRYGSVPPGIAQNQRFTGGVVQHQPGGVNFNAPPDFAGPSYSSLGGNNGGTTMHPLATALTALLGMGNSGGISSPPPSPPPISSTARLAAQVAGPALNVGSYNPGTSAAQAAASTPRWDPASSIPALTALAAQFGKKINPSSGTGGTFQY